MFYIRHRLSCRNRNNKRLLFDSFPNLTDHRLKLERLHRQDQHICVLCNLFIICSHANGKRILDLCQRLFIPAGNDDILMMITFFV